MNQLFAFYQSLQDLQQTAKGPEELEQWLILTVGRTNNCCGTVNEVNAAATRELGVLYAGTGRLLEAERKLLRAAQLTRQAHGLDSWEWISTQIHLGKVLHQNGRNDQVLVCLSEAEGRCRGREECRRLQSMALSAMARVLMDTGHLTQSVECARNALMVSCDLPDCAEQTVETNLLLSALYLQMGHPEQAEAEATAGVAKAQKGAVDRYACADALNALAVARFQRQDFAGAQSAFAEELDLLCQDLKRLEGQRQ